LNIFVKCNPFSKLSIDIGPVA